MIWLWVLGRPIEQRIGFSRTLVLTLSSRDRIQYAPIFDERPPLSRLFGIVMGLAGFIWMREKVAPWEGYPLNRATVLFLLLFIGAIFAPAGGLFLHPNFFHSQFRAEHREHGPYCRRSDRGSFGTILLFCAASAEMSVRDIVILGCSSQQPTRFRNHGAYLLRWNDEGLLFDPGEGTQRQFIFAEIAPPIVTRIFISHFHGDHCLGLGSMLMRLNLDKVTHPIHCYYPASGKKYFDRLRYCCIYRENIHVVEHPGQKSGPCRR